MALGADDPALRAAVDQALAPAAAAPRPGPPPQLVMTGMGIEINATVHAGEKIVAITIVNHIMAATCPVSIDAVDQIIEQLNQAKRDALGLHVAGGLARP